MLDSFLVGIFVAIVVALGRLAWEAAMKDWALPSLPEFNVLCGIAFPVVFFLARTIAETRGEQTFGQKAFLLRVIPVQDVDSEGTRAEGTPIGGSSDLESGYESSHGVWQAAARNSYLLLMVLLLTDLEPVVGVVFVFLMIWVALFRWHPFDQLADKRVIVEKTS